MSPQRLLNVRKQKAAKDTKKNEKNHRGPSDSFRKIRWLSNRGIIKNSIKRAGKSRKTGSFRCFLCKGGFRTILQKKEAISLFFFKSSNRKNSDRYKYNLYVIRKMKTRTFESWD